MDHFFEFDFKGDDELISSFSQFITMDMASVLTGPAKQLEVALNRKVVVTKHEVFLTPCRFKEMILEK